MKKLFASILLRKFNRRGRRIVVEPNPHTMRGVFERSGLTLCTQDSAPFDRAQDRLSPQHWEWPRGTWFQQRRALRTLRQGSGQAGK